MNDGVFDNNEIRQTVVYTVAIESANAGAWYKQSIGDHFNCILDIIDRPFFGGQEIVFRVLLPHRKLKYIKQQHCAVIHQRIASHKELMNYYGNNK